VSDDADVLRHAELDMLEESAEASLRVLAALERMREADAALEAVRGPSWGSEVYEWHAARDALSDALEALAAYGEFEPFKWW
jgi:hypothetical protein